MNTVPTSIATDPWRAAHQDDDHTAALIAQIERSQAAFAEHPFFERLREAPRVDAFNFAPALAFWVLAFQDLLRKNCELVRDAELRRIAQHHLVEDRGHDEWYLADLERLGLPGTDLRAAFAAPLRRVREATFALFAEVFRASRDATRIVLLVTLEAAGNVFFERVAAYADHVGLGKDLRYFARYHLDIERDHDLHTSSSRLVLASLLADEHVRREAGGVVERCFDAFGEMMTGVLEAEVRS